MGFGAFLGGAVKGVQIGADMYNQYKRTEIAGQDAALRKQAGDREQTRYKREEDAAARQDRLREEMAANVDKVFGPQQAATPETTETLTGPLDAHDARAGTMDGVQTQVTTPAQEAKGGMQGINLMDPANHGKLLQLESLNMASQMRTGTMKPEQVRQYQAWGRKMEQEGTADAFRQFMTGDTSGLDKLAEKNGVKSYGTEFSNDAGYPQLMFKMEKNDGTIQRIPASIFAAGLGANDMASTIDKQEDNTVKGLQVKANAAYQNRSLEVQEKRAGIEDKRADAAIQTGRERVAAFRERTAVRAAGKGDQGPTYDPKMLPDLVSKTPPMLPQIGKAPLGALGAQKPQEDQDAINAIVSIGNDYYSRGTDPVEAERIGRTTVERAGQAAMKEMTDKSTTQQFLTRRAELIQQAREQLSKQKPAATDSAPSLKISPATQKARDTDRVGILRQERSDLTGRLSAATDPAERSRLQADLDALDRELGGMNRQASAIRTR